MTTVVSRRPKPRRQCRQSKQDRRTAAESSAQATPQRATAKRSNSVAAPRVNWRSAPFAGLITVLLAVGLIALLMVNNSLAAGSFEQADLRAEKTLLFEQEQGLNQQVLALSSPTQLRISARELGLVAATTTVYLDLLTGEISGVPKPAKGAALFPGSATPSTSTLENPAAATPATATSANPATPDVSGDGASVSSGTAYDRAVVSGAGE
jgi:hypothetical protein